MGLLKVVSTKSMGFLQDVCLQTSWGSCLFRLPGEAIEFENTVVSSGRVPELLLAERLGQPLNLLAKYQDENLYLLFSFLSYPLTLGTVSPYIPV